MTRKLLALLLVLVCVSAEAAVLPKKGDIAVLVEGDDEQQVKMAEAQIINSLVSHGYRVVDEAKMKKMKMASARTQAARLAMQGNFAAIFKINTSYSVGASIVARVQAGDPVQNEFKLYTGDAVVSVIAATSGGVTLGGKTSMVKQLGYTQYEAKMKAIQNAVEDAMNQMY